SGSLNSDTAILALLVPAVAPVRNGFRCQVLEDAQQHLVFWNAELPASNADGNELLIRAEDGGGNVLLVHGEMVTRVAAVGGKWRASVLRCVIVHTFRN